MMGGLTGFLWGSLIIVLLLLGFAYIIWAIASKEKGAVKNIGQAIAIVIAVLAIFIFLYGSVYGGMFGGCGGKGYMMGKGMMRYKEGADESKMYEYMEKVMKKPGMHEWMEKYMEKNK
ncbi:MAG: hypothetical protein KKB81_00100 [Candidatus Margulisbacteria bacterium]|nr:hypothetical protein [Candidatus Margulisiibacteriota bacterium]MBU1022356.1 hypothetical protein [Candidatus Margulisiibacteriota bacterium]MBU1729092.1 hypothetical protein [Candidatus Margulisiibacteriota bacterium]MBU1954487.1 hypothetical protein [Candidatus Margulisiibacteriota bacterium]